MNRTPITRIVTMPALVLGLGLTTPGCAERKSHSLAIEGPENKYELELESVDKDGLFEDED